MLAAGADAKAGQPRRTAAQAAWHRTAIRCRVQRQVRTVLLKRADRNTAGVAAVFHLRPPHLRSSATGGVHMRSCYGHAGRAPADPAAGRPADV